MSFCPLSLKNFEVEADDLVAISELGRGAYGVVEKVRHAQSGTIMAVKVRGHLSGTGVRRGSSRGAGELLSSPGCGKMGIGLSGLAASWCALAGEGSVLGTVGLITGLEIQDWCLQCKAGM